MLVEKTVMEDGSAVQGSLHLTTISKASKSDVCFPLISSGRKRAPSLAALTSIIEQDLTQSTGRLTLRVKATEDIALPRPTSREHDTIQPSESRLSLDDLPPEVQGRILDFVFGDMHSVGASSTTLQSTHVSSSMRHPRRKAVSDLALISPIWRELVQERIYRHIKIKGTRAALQESENYFCSHMHLTRHVRHIEFWVPVWGDKASLPLTTFDTRDDQNRSNHLYDNHATLMPMNDPLGLSFKLSVYSATLSQIFAHISCFFPEACIFTLEGGHCKNSQMIRHFPKVLFNTGAFQKLEKLPQIRTFAMRGAWNIMREYPHWQTLQSALPNLEEWHCGYAKPRTEANSIINQILLHPPSALNHINISLDGMYSKDNGSPTLGSNHSTSPHLCESLGAVAPTLESVSYTGKMCSCFWDAAISSVQNHTNTSTNKPFESKLRAIEIIVKSCCRSRPSSTLSDSSSSDIPSTLLSADNPTITNLSFIRAFTHLIQSTILALPYFPHLSYIRIRFIDLDSPCTLLNPYWQLKNNVVNGIWNEDLVEALEQARPEASYEELSDGLGNGWSTKEDEENAFYDTWDGQRAPLPGHPAPHAGAGGNGFWTAGGNVVGANLAAAGHVNAASAVNGGNIWAGNGQNLGQGVGGWSALYPKIKPRSIKTSSYRILMEVGRA